MNKQTRAIMARFVEDLRGLSKCEDRQTACIICDSELRQVYSIGVNGGPKQMNNYQCLCASESKYSCIHAEANALIKLTQMVPNKVMICSLAPCMQCASMIVNEPGGFGSVLFLEPWKETGALNILREHGIRVGLLTLDGEIKNVPL